MGAGFFGFFMGAATAVLIMKVFRRQEIKAKPETFEPDPKIKGAMREIDEITSVLGKLSKAKESDPEGTSLDREWFSFTPDNFTFCFSCRFCPSVECAIDSSCGPD
jgi:hypothetical protein